MAIDMVPIDFSDFGQAQWVDVQLFPDPIPGAVRLSVTGDGLPGDTLR